MTSLFLATSIRLMADFIAGGNLLSWFQVLVACSDPGRRTALVDILVQRGLEPMVATNVGEVRAVFAQRPVHLVFCEDDLPEGGFREVLQFAKATESGVPLVVCSLLGELDEYLNAMELGAFDFIAPPYRGADIASVINSVHKDCWAKRIGETRPCTPVEAAPQDRGAAA